MASGEEKKITNKILKYLNRLEGGRAVKVHGGFYGNNGEPDIDCVIKGQSYKIEVKVPGKEPTRLQYKIMEKWRKAGAKAFYVTSLDELKEKM